MELLISLPERMVESLILTIIIELVFAWISEIRGTRTLILIMVTNFLTNPLLIFTHTVLVTLGYPHWPTVILLELLVIAIEWTVYRRLAKEIKRPLIFSLSANLTSFFTGMVFNYLF